MSWILVFTTHWLHLMIWRLFHRLTSGSVHSKAFFSNTLHSFLLPSAVGHVRRVMELVAPYPWEDAEGAGVYSVPGSHFLHCDFLQSSGWIPSLLLRDFYLRGQCGHWQSPWRIMGDMASFSLCPIPDCGPSQMLPRMTRQDSTEMLVGSSATVPNQGHMTESFGVWRGCLKAILMHSSPHPLRLIKTKSLGVRPRHLI